MSVFDERECAFEAKFAHDEAVRFRVHARRDKLLGLWAGQKLGKSGPALQDYAMSLVLSELGRDGEAVLRKQIVDDFARARLPLSDSDLAQKMNEFFAEAMRQLALSE